MKKIILFIFMIFTFGVNAYASTSSMWEVSKIIENNEDLKEIYGGKYIENGYIFICVTDIEKIRNLASSLTGEAKEYVVFKEVKYTAKELFEANNKIWGIGFDEIYFSETNYKENAVNVGVENGISDETKNKIINAAGIDNIIFKNCYSKPVIEEKTPETVKYTAKVGDNFIFKDKGEKIYLDGNDKILIHNGKIMVPLRFVVNTIDKDAKIKWNDVKKTAVIEMGARLTEVTAGKDTMKINGVDGIEMETESIIENGKIYLSIYDIALASGLPFSWCGYDSEENEVFWHGEK
jgi:hypothetical protein